MPKIVNPVFTHSHKENKSGQKINQNNKNFNEILRQQLKSDLNITRHAQNRIENRGINIDTATAHRLDKAMDALKQKGGKGSLLLSDDVAYVVNPQTKTVITAVDKSSLKEKVFTNIDSAMLI
ncbi:TIGR02530 family flagellar biosynthesis protein [Proteinivorax tanatarense]|uniref:TIGR02530 family flagellar biosynthesis protein n=1 Tax=Proteinivorax tanatarense TaxID=1260629 RepID=A0AAU7VQB1_9FIRM